MRGREQVRGSSGQLCKLTPPTPPNLFCLLNNRLNKFCDRNKTRLVACWEGPQKVCVCVHGDALLCEKTSKNPSKSDGQSQQLQVPSGTSCLHYPRPPLPLLLFPAAGTTWGQRLGRATHTYRHTRTQQTGLDGKGMQTQSSGRHDWHRSFLFLFFPNDNSRKAKNKRRPC